MNLRKLIPLFAFLAIAVVGVSYAAIPSANGTITACKDNKGALKVIDAEAGQACPGNTQPLTWNQQGPQGAPGVSERQVVHSYGSYGSATYREEWVTCPTGKQVLGGGGVAVQQNGNSETAAQDVAIVATNPVSDKFWQVIAKAGSGQTVPWYLHTSAVCAVVG